ncbi:unnamed protein product [Anisakis simplex]|uniref:Flavin-containing monooxygenase n=1 Tax=Anisakis simplex TaxID=6269 RepID=A0A158PNW9_ANISI|nr:unnamed protein product [Anisakis simplex]
MCHAASTKKPDCSKRVSRSGDMTKFVTMDDAYIYFTLHPLNFLNNQMNLITIIVIKMKICVVGAGASGLPAIKCAVENGFSVVCLEKSSDIGGLWRFKKDPCPGEGTVMKSTTINTSKEMTAYSDYPPAADAPNYMHNTELMKYFRSYVEHFDLLKHISFNTKVTSIKRNDKYDDTGEWDVTYVAMKLVCNSRFVNNEERTEVFGGVLLCSGHHVDPYWPTPFKGQQNFRGEILHSHDYKDPIRFNDKKVVVIGIGNSGGDIAVELSRIAKKIKSNVESFSESSVQFDDGTEVCDVDVVIFATGYSFGFPVLEHGKLIEVVENEVSLYLHMYPTELASKNTLAVIGFIEPVGALAPVSEMQCRVFCGVLSGRTILPTAFDMQKNIDEKRKAMEKQYVRRRRHTIQAPYIEYMDELAKLINVKPNLFKYMFTDPNLTRVLIFHGLASYQYRLVGPNSWSGARKALMTMEERVFEVTRTRRTMETLKSKPCNKFLQII